ncbi:anaphase-promoting complex subunit 1-like [Lycorma delicatula]|uniref:anaphase-promoting complex subunit 1-like n=1 Tax=Lycorma delicatula TaxID=130591 RepID=UPI003F51398E
MLLIYLCSSLMSSTVVGDPVFDDQVHLLSPIPSTAADVFDSSIGTVIHSTPRDGYLQSLRDPVANRLTLEFLNGSMFRISLPEVCSSPLGLLGYDVEKLSVLQQNSGTIPDIPTQILKKKQAADYGSQDDWEYLLNSCHHKIVSRDLCSLLELKRAHLANNDLPSNGDVCGKINTSAPLFSAIYLIIFSFHLLYEVAMDKGTIKGSTNNFITYKSINNSLNDGIISESSIECNCAYGDVTIENLIENISSENKLLEQKECYIIGRTYNYF